MTRAASSEFCGEGRGEIRGREESWGGARRGETSRVESDSNL